MADWRSEFSSIPRYLYHPLRSTGITNCTSMSLNCALGYFMRIQEGSSGPYPIKSPATACIEGYITPSYPKHHRSDHQKEDLVGRHLALHSQMLTTSRFHQICTCLGYGPEFVARSRAFSQAYKTQFQHALVFREPQGLGWTYRGLGPYFFGPWVYLGQHTTHTEPLRYPGQAEDDAMQE